VSDYIFSFKRQPVRAAQLATILLTTAAIVTTEAAQRRRPSPPPQKSTQSSSSGKPAAPKNQPNEKTSEAFTKLKPLQDKQDWAGMLALLESIPITPGSYDEALILDMKAKLYAQQNQLSKVIAPWERVVELNDQHHYFSDKQILETVAILAQLLGQEGFTAKNPAQKQENFAKAIKYFKRFLDKTPKPTAEIMMGYASVLYSKAVIDEKNVDQALLKEARSVVEKGLMTSVKPKEGFYQLLLTLQQQQNDMAGSAEVLELLLKSSPTKKDFWQMLYAMYLQLSEKAREKDPTLAREYMTRAIVTIERAQALGFLNSPKENMTLVTLYLTGVGQFTKGTELLYNGMKSGKIENEPINWRVLGRFYVEANQNENALKVLDEAAKLFPKNSEIEVQISQIYMQMEKSKEALQHVKSAIAKGNFETTKPFSVHYLAAYIAYDLGDIDDAAKSIALAEKFPEASKDPQFPKLKGVIAEALAERESKAKEAEQKKTAAKKTASL
jgi:tetratricopeptide (TPR) repeat protein